MLNLFYCKLATSSTIEQISSAKIPVCSLSSNAPDFWLLHLLIHILKHILMQPSIILVTYFWLHTTWCFHLPLHCLTFQSVSCLRLPKTSQCICNGPQFSQLVNFLICITPGPVQLGSTQTSCSLSVTSSISVPVAKLFFAFVAIDVSLWSYHNIGIFLQLGVSHYCLKLSFHSHYFDCHLSSFCFLLLVLICTPSQILFTWVFPPKTTMISHSIELSYYK